MTTTKSIHRSVATLKLPKKVPALITYAQGIVKGMTNNSSFPTPAPTLPAITEALNALQTAETAALARACVPPSSEHSSTVDSTRRSASTEAR